MLGPSAATKHHLYLHHLPVGTHSTPVCNFHVLNVNLQLIMQLIMQSALPIKEASQKNWMPLGCKGYKVLFLKQTHYHNKEHIISVIKRARCRHMAPHTTQQVCAVWAELENSVMSIDEWEEK